MKRQGKKMTPNYWNSLDVQTRTRAVRKALPDMPQSFAESLAREKVNVRSPWFKVAVRCRSAAGGRQRVQVRGSWSVLQLAR